jgi:hypothetical protein
MPLQELDSSLTVSKNKAPFAAAMNCHGNRNRREIAQPLAIMVADPYNSRKARLQTGGECRHQRFTMLMNSPRLEESAGTSRCDTSTFEQLY